MADNALALLHHFTGASSPLPSMATKTPQKPRVVYFSVLGTWFISYSYSVASVMYTTLLVAVITLLQVTSSSSSTIDLFKLQLRGLRNILSGLVGALLGANIVAFFMSMVFNKDLSWFSREWLPLVLYGPPAVTGTVIGIHSNMANRLSVGALVPQLFFFHPVRQDESATLSSTLLLYSLLSVMLHSIFGLGSASFFFIIALPLYLVLSLNAVQNERFEDVSLRTYVLAGLVPLIVGTEIWFGTADVFVPLVSSLCVTGTFCSRFPESDWSDGRGKLNH